MTDLRPRPLGGGEPVPVDASSSAEAGTGGGLENKNLIHESSSIDETLRAVIDGLRLAAARDDFSIPFRMKLETAANAIKSLAADNRRLRAVLKGYACAGLPTCATPRTLNYQCVYALIGNHGSRCGEAAKAAVEQLTTVHDRTMTAQSEPTPAPPS